LADASRLSDLGAQGIIDKAKQIVLTNGLIKF